MKKTPIFIIACMIALLSTDRVNAQKKVDSKSKPAGNVTVQTESARKSTGQQTSPPARSVSGTNVKSLPPRPTPESARKSSGGAKTSGNAN